MKLEILGKQIEIDDAKIKEIFNAKFNELSKNDINRNEFDYCALEYFGLFFEERFLTLIERVLGFSVVAMKDIAIYKYFEKTPPFNKPWAELHPDSLPWHYLPSISLQKFMDKLNITPERDEDLIKKRREEDEEVQNKMFEEFESRKPIEFQRWNAMKRKKKS